MIKIVENTSIPIGTIPMGDMKPLQVGIIRERLNESNIYNGNLVMRTASESKFEVFNLTNPGRLKCWTDIEPGYGTLVQLLAPGESITIQISND